MRAILIDPQSQTIREVAHTGDYKEIYGFIGNECKMFQAPFSLPNGDTFYCDEEGLFHENIGAIMYPDWHTPIVGRVLILNTDYETGDSQSAKSSIEAIRKGLRFIGADEFVLTNWFAQF